MISVRLLHELQAVDHELDRRHARLAEIDARLGDDTALAGLRGESADLGASIDQTGAVQRELESAAASFSDRIGQAEARLYGGTVTSPRELSDLQADVEYLKRRRSEQEERLLTVIEEVEGLQSNLRGVDSQLQREERAWEAEQASMVQEQQKLNGEVKQFSVTRAGMAKRVPALDLALYERVRRVHEGRAVAQVQQGRCEACHIALPTRQLQAVRTSSAPVRCASCGLILLAD